MHHRYKTGDRITHRPCFGMAAPEVATIINTNEKNGRPVYGLDNGHWTYESQIVGLAPAAAPAIAPGHYVVGVLADIDWAMLARQKESLIHILRLFECKPGHPLEGILSLLDSLQDAAELDGYPVVWLTEPLEGVS